MSSEIITPKDTCPLQFCNGVKQGVLVISIVMPSYNQADFIGRAIESVFNQDVKDIELIVSDGGSTDATLGILEEKSKTYKGLIWTSEPDDGPASALNKSLEKARGTIIGWLNSDDCYRPNIFGKINAYFQNHPSKLIVYGHGEHTDINDNVIDLYPTQKPDIGMDAFKAGCFICQPTVFFRHTLYVLQGPLDEQFKASFDYEYWLRAFLHFQERIGFIDSVIAQSRLHDGGITYKHRARVAVEGARLSKQYFGAPSLHWLVTYIEELEIAESVKFQDLEAGRQAKIFEKFKDIYSEKDIERLKESL